LHGLYKITCCTESINWQCSLYLSAVTSKGGQSFWIKVNGSGQKQAARLSDHNLLGSRCKLGVRRGGCSTGTRLLPLMQHRRKVRESIELADNRSSYCKTISQTCKPHCMYVSKQGITLAAAW